MGEFLRVFFGLRHILVGCVLRGKVPGGRPHVSVVAFVAPLLKHKGLDLSLPLLGGLLVAWPQLLADVAERPAEPGYVTVQRRSTLLPRHLRDRRLCKDLRVELLERLPAELEVDVPTRKLRVQDPEEYSLRTQQD